MSTYCVYLSTRIRLVNIVRESGNKNRPDPYINRRILPPEKIISAVFLGNIMTVVLPSWSAVDVIR